MPYLKVPGAELYYEAIGEGPAVVLVHAGICNLRMWDREAALLAEAGYRALRYDTRGAGQSRTTSAETFSNRADLIALLDHCAVERALLVGCSRGGQIALDSALDYPERVSGLLLACAGLSGFAGPVALTEAEEALFAVLEAAEESGDLDQINELEIQVFVDGVGQPSDRVAPDLRAAVSAMNRANMGRAEPTPPVIPLDPAAAERLNEVAVPTAVIIGELDSSIEQAFAEAMASGIAGATLHRFANVAHLPNLEQPERFAEVLLDLAQRAR